MSQKVSSQGFCGLRASLVNLVSQLIIKENEETICFKLECWESVNTKNQRQIPRGVGAKTSLSTLGLANTWDRMKQS